MVNYNQTRTNLNQFNTSFFKGGLDLINKLKVDVNLAKSKDAMEALEDLELLFKYCSIFSIEKKVITYLKSFSLNYNYLTFLFSKLASF